MAQEPRLAGVIEAIDRDYQRLTVHLRPAPALEFDFDRRTMDIGPVAQQGQNRRAELNDHLGLKPGDRLALIYLGVYGPGKGLIGPASDLARRSDWRLVGFESDLPLPGYTRLDPGRWLHRDVIVSADVIIAKLGYSILTTVMAGGRPIVFPPRPDWPEQPALEKAVGRWGGGLKVSARDFQDLRLSSALDEAFELAPAALPADGADQAAEAIGRLA